MNGQRIVAVGIRDNDLNQFGGVYTLNESASPSGWTDTGMGNYDVVAVAFSPNYAVDRQLIAVGSNETGTLVTSRSGNAGWGTTSGNASIGGVVPVRAVVALPAGFSTTFFVGIDTGSSSGDVYRIVNAASPNSSTAVDLNAGAADNLTGLDIAGLAVSASNGSYHILAGASLSARVYLSSDGGQNWTRSAKDPTGQSRTSLVMTPNFNTSRRAYAVSCGTGSAFSYSVDGGLTWNQLSLIDTAISALVDFAVSPRYGQDTTLFLLTWGGEHSLWRSQNGGTSWERILTGAAAGAAGITHLEISPQYGAAETVVYLAGAAGGQGATWKSRDSGQTFARRPAGFPIDALTVVNNDSFFAGSYNGTYGLIYGTSTGGASYATPSVVGSQPLKSLVLSPGYAQDRTLLAGNANGWVYLSVDNGASFEPVPYGAAAPPLTGNVFAGFDPQFVQNRIIYAASDSVATASSRERIFRFSVGRSLRWESIDGNITSGSKMGPLFILPNGMLYAANSRDNGGMERSLNPGSQTNQVFEMVSQGLTDNAALSGLWGWGNQLWSLDTRNSKLVTYVDSLVSPVTPVSPQNGAQGVDTRSVLLEWAALNGATGYEWQVDYDGSFTSVPSTLKGETIATSVRLPALDTAATYYWRVRATRPTLSLWSPVRSFNTILGAAGTVPELYSPKAGAEGVALRPVFQWGNVAGAQRYEVLVAANVSFTSPVVARTGANALAATAWQSDIDFSYNTTYFWKVRGISDNSYSVWSNIGTFTTALPPPVASPPLMGITIDLYSPGAGAEGVPVKPVFQWSSVAGAERYEL